MEKVLARIPVILEANKTAKCNWFGTGYSWLVYGFLYLTFFYVLAHIFRMRNIAMLQRVWLIVAYVAALSTLIFYSQCHKTLPRATVLG